MPYPLVYEPLVRAALLEDLGRAGDLTTDTVVPADAKARARFVARHPGRVAGLTVSLSAFRLLDPDLSIETLIPDGSDVSPGDTLAVVSGLARPILSAERTALNLLGRCAASRPPRAAWFRRWRAARRASPAPARPHPVCAPWRRRRCVLAAAATTASAWMTPC